MKSLIPTVAMTLLSISGCGGAPQTNYDHVSLVPVSGTVTLDGSPLPDAVVKFEGRDGQFSMGRTNGQGEYTLQFDSEKAGVTPGEKIVRISTAATLGEEGEEEAGEDEEPEASSTPERVPAKYNVSSELKRTVAKDGTREFNFDLKSE